MLFIIFVLLRLGLFIDRLCIRAAYLVLEVWLGLASLGEGGRGGTAVHCWRPMERQCWGWGDEEMGEEIRGRALSSSIVRVCERENARAENTCVV